MRQGCYKNDDLWCRTGAALKRRRRVSVCKVRAHVLAPDSVHDLAAHTWTSVVGNELADALVEKGALLHEVPGGRCGVSANGCRARRAFRCYPPLRLISTTQSSRC